MHGFLQQSLRLRRAAAVTALLLSAALLANAAQAQTKIVAGMVAHGPPQWPQYIASEFGWFKQDNIELDLIAVGAGGAQQLAGGSLNIAHSGFPDFARASLQGAPVKIIINDIVASPYAVFAKPGIREIAELKGKLVSIGGVKDVTLIYMKAFLASAGLQTGDVDFVYAKAAGDRLSALVSGGVDATILNPPTYFKAISLGFSNLGDIEPHARNIPFTVWAANTDWAAKNRAALIAFAKSYKRGVRWLYDPANKEAAVDIMVKHAKQDRNDTTQAYDYLVARLKLFGVDGGVPDAAYEKMAEGLIDLGDMKKPVPPKSVIRMAERVALITGGGGEIGGAIARRFAQEGAKVAIADLDPAKARAVAGAIAESGGEAHALEVDVADERSAEAAVAETIDAFRKLTTLVNVAAAVTPDGTVETLTLAQWNHAIGVNLTGAFLMCKYAVPQLRRAGGGSIINIASQLGHLGVALRSPYCTTKAALMHFTRILAMDHAADKIRANTISPGFILTERSSARSGGKEQARIRNGPRHLLNRPGEPKEIAAGALYLASDEASFVTASDLLIDGGYIAFKGNIGPDGRPLA